MYDILELNEKLVGELREIATSLNIENIEGLKKQDLVYKILDHQAAHPELVKSKKKDKPEKIEKAEKPERQPRADKQEKTKPEPVVPQAPAAASPRSEERR